MLAALLWGAEDKLATERKVAGVNACHFPTTLTRVMGFLRFYAVALFVTASDHVDTDAVADPAFGEPTTTDNNDVIHSGDDQNGVDANARPEPEVGVANATDESSTPEIDSSGFGSSMPTAGNDSDGYDVTQVKFVCRKSAIAIELIR